MAKTTKKAVKVLKPTKSVVVLSPEENKEKIADLKSAMSQSVAESTSISILSLLLFIGAPSVFPEIINPYLPSSLKIMQAFVIIPTAFLLITFLVNAVRCIKILKLQGRFTTKK